MTAEPIAVDAPKTRPAPAPLPPLPALPPLPTPKAADKPAEPVKVTEAPATPAVASPASTPAPKKAGLGKKLVVAAASALSLTAGVAGVWYFGPGDEPAATGTPTAAAPGAPAPREPVIFEKPVIDHPKPIAETIPPTAVPVAPAATPTGPAVPAGVPARPVAVIEPVLEPIPSAGPAVPVVPAAPAYEPKLPKPDLAAAPPAIEVPTRPPAVTQAGGTEPAPLIPAAPPVVPAAAPQVPAIPAAGPVTPAPPALPAAPGTGPAMPALPSTPAAPSLPAIPAPGGAPALPPAPPASLPPAPVDVAPKLPAPPSAVVPPVGPGTAAPAEPTKPLPEPAFVPSPAPKGPSVSPPPVTGAPVVPSLPPEPEITKPVTPKFDAPKPEPKLNPPVSATPTPPASERPSPDFTRADPKANVTPVAAIERAPVTSFDVDLHEPKAGDTYESISREFYNDPRYSAALRAYNRNKPLQGSGPIDVPPLHVLKRYLQGGSGGPKPAATVPVSQPGGVPEWGSATPAGSPVRSTGSEKTFRVPTGGMSMRAIARVTLGNEQRWNDVYALNPQFKADEPLPAGTEVKLPADARMP